MTDEGKSAWEPFSASAPLVPSPAAPGVKQGLSYSGLHTQPRPPGQLLFVQGWNCGTSQCSYVNK